MKFNNRKIKNHPPSPIQMCKGYLCARSDDGSATSDRDDGLRVTCVPVVTMVPAPVTVTMVWGLPACP